MTGAGKRRDRRGAGRGTTVGARVGDPRLGDRRWIGRTAALRERVPGSARARVNAGQRRNRPSFGGVPFFVAQRARAIRIGAVDMPREHMGSVMRTYLATLLALTALGALAGPAAAVPPTRQTISRGSGPRPAGFPCAGRST